MSGSPTPWSEGEERSSPQFTVVTDDFRGMLVLAILAGKTILPNQCVWTVHLTSINIE